MKLYSTVVFVAVIIAWSAGKWGMVDGKTVDECQALADAMAKQSAAPREICRPVNDSTYERMKQVGTAGVQWMSGEVEGRIVYACNRKRCREVE